MRRNAGRQANQTYRKLYVLKKEYHDPVAKNLVQYLPSYHKHINMLKDNGYCQKSRTPEDAEVRRRLLQSMVKHLKERSLVEHEFISP
ncbi:predicted protein [Lichtheimia corymbifera JMRC:FSU:9682]|uniref:Uncharacterized protein n=1 Tax=Lichtheimia corymbifera JMRC:FSU:9682 TaxID=1263082 RepID=A0A068RQR1_9FUNG|nr:predicted protein [Lichtheimia corymbifera JMRC:FSU:9682]